LPVLVGPRTALTRAANPDMAEVMGQDVWGSSGGLQAVSGDELRFVHGRVAGARLCWVIAMR
jgi:hypothetical protein